MLKCVNSTYFSSHGFELHSIVLLFAMIRDSKDSEGFHSFELSFSFLKLRVGDSGSRSLGIVRCSITVRLCL